MLTLHQRLLLYSLSTDTDHSDHCFNHDCHNCLFNATLSVIKLSHGSKLATSGHWRYTLESLCNDHHICLLGNEKLLDSIT